MSLTDALPIPGEPDAALDAFIDWVAGQGIELYDAQTEAVLALATGANVVLGTPTGSGKSLVAVGAHALALAQGRRSFYTAPIKALVSEKFFALCEVFGADRVGMMTGDAAVNADAPIICATAEVLANLALRDREDADVGLVVADEFHFYAEPDRGWAWQVPLLMLPRPARPTASDPAAGTSGPTGQPQFLLMSATLGDTTDLAEDLHRRTGRDSVQVTGAVRPVPLEFEWAMRPMHEVLELLLADDRAPVYVVHFSQAAAIERAQALMSLNVCSAEQKAAIAELVGGFRFGRGFGATLRRFVRHGIGVHHAGMLPKYRRLVETLAQAGLLKVICGTDTLGVGINVPIRTVVVSDLTKYDGRKQRLLNAREFHQIAGRAGRAGFDVRGYVVVQAPDHVIENAKLVAKAGDDPKKLRKVKRKKPPEGQLSYTEATFERLVAAEPEPLRSRMRITHAMLLNLLERVPGQREALRALLRDNHSEPDAQDRLVERAAQILASLVQAQVIEVVDGPGPRRATPEGQGQLADDGEGEPGGVGGEGEPGGIHHEAALASTYRVVEDLQDGFALNQPLSAFALAAFDLLDEESPTHHLDVLSVIEATLEDPRPVLRAQQFLARGEAVAELKAEGLDYAERMALLDDVTWPRPLAELLEHALGLYRQSHPWVSPHDLSPKSVVREMYEQGLSFGEFVGAYRLGRSEGVLLRYLSDAYRAMRNTVPVSVGGDEVDDLIEWLGELVRQTDSSLLDEWEALTSSEGDRSGTAPATTSAAPRVLSANPRALRVMARQAMFRRVELVALGRWAALAEVDDGLSEQEWATAGEAYYEEYVDVGTGPSARGPALFAIEAPDSDDGEPGVWLLTQILEDPNDDRDWRITARLDLGATDEAGELVVTTTSFAPA